MKRKKLFFFLFFLSVSFSIYSEDLPDLSTKIPRKVCVFSVSDINENTKQENEALFKDSIKQNLLLELKVLGFTIVDEKIWKEKQRESNITDNDLFEGPIAMSLAAQSEADVAITGFLSLSNKKILFGIKCYDVKAKRLAATVIKGGRQGLSVASLINEAIAEIMPKIKKSLDVYVVKEGEIEKEVTVYKDITLKEIKSMGTLVNLTLTSQDGDASIFLADNLTGKITDGKIALSVSANSNLIVKLTKPQYYDSTQEVKVGEEDSTVALKPMYKTSFPLQPEIEYTVFQFFGLGIGLRYYIATPWFDLTDWTFLNLNNYLYAQLNRGENISPVMHDDINFSLNQYLLTGPDSLFRFGIFIGTGLIITFFTVPDMPVFSDFYFDIFGAWLELNFTGFKIYYRIAGRYYTNFFDIIKNELMGVGMGDMGPNVSIGAVLKW